MGIHINDQLTSLSALPTLLEGLYGRVNTHRCALFQSQPCLQRNLNANVVRFRCVFQDELLRWEGRILLHTETSAFNCVTPPMIFDRNDVLSFLLFIASLSICKSPAFAFMTLAVFRNCSFAMSSLVLSTFSFYTFSFSPPSPLLFVVLRRLLFLFLITPVVIGVAAVRRRRRHRRRYRLLLVL